MADMGHIKRNPETGSVAVRTHFDESVPELAGLAWAVINPGPGPGPRRLTSAEVEGWDDVFAPEVAE